MRTQILLVAAAGFVASTALAQSKIPERTLGAPTAVGTESFRNIASVRELSDGRVIVVERGPLNAAIRGMMTEMARRMMAARGGRGGRGTPSDTTDSNSRAFAAMIAGSQSDTPRAARVMIFDRGLGTATPVRAAGAQPAEFGQPTELIAGLADSTYLVDGNANDLLVIDPSGALVSTRSSAAGPGAVLVAGGVAIDKAGRLLYQAHQTVSRSTADGLLSGTPDTAAIIAYDFKTGGTIPVASVHVMPTSTLMKHDTASGGGMRLVSTPIPFPTVDDWIVMPDGTLAIIRGSDFHVDWIAPNGKKRSTAPIPYTKVAVTDSDKVKFANALKMGSDVVKGVVPGVMSYEQTAPDSFPQFKPPFATRGAKAASDGTIWIPAHMLVPTVPDGFYVIGPEGKVREHVHLMNRQRLLGFGKGVVYVAINQGPQDVRLARVPLR